MSVVNETLIRDVVTEVLGRLGQPSTPAPVARSSPAKDHCGCNGKGRAGSGTSRGRFGVYQDADEACAAAQEAFLQLQEKGIAAQVLTDAGVNLDAARAETLRLLGTEMPQGNAPTAQQGSGSAQSTPPKGEKKSKTPALDHFCRDLTQLAAEGQLDPTIGRFKEIERVMEVLSRRKKNNPVLIGEPGVGKTAIVEGLAQLIANNECPDSLRDHRVLVRRQRPVDEFIQLVLVRMRAHLSSASRSSRLARNSCAFEVPIAMPVSRAISSCV